MIVDPTAPTPRLVQMTLPDERLPQTLQLVTFEVTDQVWREIGEQNHDR